MNDTPTPDTDSAQCEGLLRGNAVPTHVVHVNFARKLERERDAALAANAELLERLRERTESHLAASARDVQTIQRQAILLDRLADALEKMLYIIGVPSAGPETLWRTDDEVNKAYHTSLEALSAYESANPEPVANPIDEAVKRMEEVPALELNKLHFDAMDYGNFNDIEAVRARLIQAAKGEQP